MRRNYISPEFLYSKVNGTLSMLEKSSFFGSKMLEIDDNIIIGTENIIWYQQANKEQISLSTENTLSPLVYNTINDKLLTHTIIIDDSQPKSQIDTTTRWIITIQLKKLFSNYLFSTLKKYRTFEGVRNNMTVFNDIDSAINDYISKNILNRYTFDSVDFYILYKSLNTVDSLRFKNIFTNTIENSDNILKKIQLDIDFNQEVLTLSFNQEKPSTFYYFDYYFNLKFKKI